MSEMPWIASYPEGVRWDIEIEALPVADAETLIGVVELDGEDD